MGQGASANDFSGSGLCPGEISQVYREQVSVASVLMRGMGVVGGDPDFLIRDPRASEVSCGESGASFTIG